MFEILLLFFDIFNYRKGANNNSRVICVLDLMLALYNSYRNVTTHFKYITRRRSFKQTQMQSRIACTRWQSWPFVYPCGQEFIITTSRARERKRRRSNYLSETQNARLSARVPPILQCVRYLAWNSSVRLWSATPFCIKKIRRSRARCNQIMESFRWFFCVKKRDIHIMRLVAFYRCLPLLSCFILHSFSIIFFERRNRLIIINRMKFLLCNYYVFH